MLLRRPWRYLTWMVGRDPYSDSASGGNGTHKYQKGVWEVAFFQTSFYLLSTNFQFVPVQMVLGVTRGQDDVGSSTCRRVILWG